MGDERVNWNVNGPNEKQRGHEGDEQVRWDTKG